jgi:xylulokinase
VGILGLDIGTQSAKAVIIDDGLAVRGRGSVAYEPTFPRAGWAEQDPNQWLGAVGPAISSALGESGLASSDVTGIGVTGQLDGCLPADAAGRALGPCLIWMDRRAEGELAGLDIDDLQRRTGLVADASHMAAKARWLSRHEGLRPDVWHQPVSFIIQALCGRAVMDHALASTTMLYNLASREYDPVLLGAFDLDQRSLPEIASADSVAGRLTAAGSELTGLPVGIPVAVGTGDDFANAIGTGVVSPGVVSCCLGTAEVVGAISPALIRDGEGLLQTHGFLRGSYLIGNPGWSAGGALSWFCRTFSVESADALSALADETAPGSGGLLFLPALTGAMAPRWVASARGAFYGIAPLHGKAELARSVLEGCAFAMRDVVDRLAEMGMGTDRIRLCGGGARSRLWAQIRADLCQREVEIARHIDAAPFGAALLASVAAGLARSVEELSPQLSGGLETIAPNPAHRDIYESRYRQYRALFDALYGTSSP